MSTNFNFARILFTFLSTGLFYVTTPVYGTGAEIVAAAAAAVSAGTSLAGTTISTLMNDGYRVTCGIEVENWTRFALTYPHASIGGGAVSQPPRPILPSKKEAMVTRKSSDSATGTYGTVSWLIEGLNRRVWVMWSMPYDFTYHSNWLGVGLSMGGWISTPEDNSMFDLMYYGSSNSQLGFSRSEYYWNVEPVLYRDDKIEVVGTMGTGHKSQVTIIVRPVNNSDLCDTIKALLQIQ